MKCRSRVPQVSSLLLAVTLTGALAGNRYVAQDGQTPDPNQQYTHWDNASSNIQDAVVAAAPNDTIWIAPGHYRLSTDEFVDGGVTNVVYIDKPLTLRASEPDQATLIDGDGLYRCVMIEYDSHAGINDWFILDGLTITNGWSTVRSAGIYIFRGPGVNRNWQRDVQILNCRIVGNRGTAGGGLWFHVARGGTGSIVVSNTVVRANESLGSEAGLSFRGVAAPVIVDCEIAFNQADRASAGVFVFNATGMSIERTVIHHNTVLNATDYPWNTSGGAGFRADTSTSTIRNSLFFNNTSDRHGGAINLNGESHLRLENCTIAYNHGGAHGAVRFNHGGSLNVLNTILYHNTDTELDAGAAILENAFTNSCVAVAVSGADNLMEPPEFVNPAAFDFRLSAGSPCINQGLYQEWMDDAVDLDGKPRIDRIFNRVDIGAYEYHPAGTLILVN